MIYLLDRVTRGDYLTIMAVSSRVANLLNVTIANAKIPITKPASNPVGMNLTVFSLSDMLDWATRDDKSFSREAGVDNCIAYISYK